MFIGSTGILIHGHALHAVCCSAPRKLLVKLGEGARNLAASAIHASNMEFSAPCPLVHSTSFSAGAVRLLLEGLAT